MRAFVRQLKPAVVVLTLATFACGVIYPLAVMLIGQVVFPAATDGSLVRRNGVVVGSSLIGQSFSGDGYLHSRPSAAGSGFDAMASSGSNLGPTNPDLITVVAERVAAYRTINGLPDSMPVPIDAVTASASGLDPHVSVANARLQAPRIAAERRISVQDVLDAIDGATVRRTLGFLGDEGVSVLSTNLALDRLGPPTP